MTELHTRRPLASNLVSELGAGIAIVGMANLAFLIYLDFRQPQSSPYFGILTWIVAPAIFIFGGLTFIAGMILERRRRRRLAPDVVPEYPRIDLNDRRTRVVTIVSAIGLVLFVTASVVGSYHAYHYTDSDEFCGTLCHEVMHPEYTAYKGSPHARVGCAGCHVGPGAGWFVRSKLSGAYQVYATLANRYPRPIPTPVANLRPAQETCEQCHWPEKFFGAQLKVFDHYAYDEENTPREVRMLIKTGGGSPEAGQTSGIHWHMNILNEVTYVAEDPKRQIIPWIQLKDRRTGRVTVYKLPGSKLTDQQIAAAPKRTMDCVDCHNRPTHIYVAPDRAVDRALRAGTIDRSLPFIKQQAVAVLSKDYPSTDAALRAIATDLVAWYRENRPDAYATRRASIDGAVTTLQQIFRTTRFPEMKVDWRTHPDNVGHLTSAGCFRCHDDQHVSADGKRISKDCSICHTMLPQSDGTVAFEHPIDIGDLRETNCADCHTGSGME
ncbi:MAG TPA: NapC/NirT family cytochrome c [Thermoanaerobaculia bacterium]|nr:NapC/NirT family cytochrome c [Thermoanaerobaculia bacterium]